MDGLDQPGRDRAPLRLSIPLILQLAFQFLAFRDRRVGLPDDAVEILAVFLLLERERVVVVASCVLGRALKHVVAEVGNRNVQAVPVRNIDVRNGVRHLAVPPRRFVRHRLRLRRPARVLHDVVVAVGPLHEALPCGEALPVTEEQREARHVVAT